MGAFITNYHLRTLSMPAVVNEVTGLAQSRAYVSPSKSGWVTITAKPEQMLRKLRAQFDRSAREILKNSPGDLPSCEELKNARDKAPEALAELIGTRARQHLTDVAVCVIPMGSKALIAALLKQGLDPNAKDSRGQTPLSAAQNRPDILEMLKSAV